MFCAPTQAVPAEDLSSARRSHAARMRTVVVQDRCESFDVQRALDRTTPGFGTAHATSEVAHADDDLPNLLAYVPALHVRSVSGLGQFATASIRGSTAAQVGVFTDGVPLTNSFAGIIDLSAIALNGVREVRVYRGFAPPQYAGGTLGGEIDLDMRPRFGTRKPTLRSGIGSFQLALTTSLTRSPTLQLRTTAGLAGVTSANDQRIVALDGYVSPRWRSALWRQAFVTVTGDVAPPWVDVHDRADIGLGTPTSRHARTPVGASVQLAWQQRLRIVPAVRIDGSVSRLTQHPPVHTGGPPAIGLPPYSLATHAP